MGVPAKQMRFADPTVIERTAGLIVDVLVQDRSPSMKEKGFLPNSSKQQCMDQAIREHVDIRRVERPDDYIAVVAYGVKAKCCCSLVNVHDDYDTLVRGLETAARFRGWGTQIQSGLRIACDILLKPEVQRIATETETLFRVIGYSDGHDSEAKEALHYAEQLKQASVLIETFGIGEKPSDVDENFLRTVASESDGFTHYRFLGCADDVQNTLHQLARGTMLTFER
jgi:hypothetical protein